MLTHTLHSKAGTIIWTSTSVTAYAVLSCHGNQRPRPGHQTECQVPDDTELHTCMHKNVHATIHSHKHTHTITHTLTHTGYSWEAYCMTIISTNPQTQLDCYTTLLSLTLSSCYVCKQTASFLPLLSQNSELHLFTHIYSSGFGAATLCNKNMGCIYFLSVPLFH